MSFYTTNNSFCSGKGVFSNLDSINVKDLGIFFKVKFVLIVHLNPSTNRVTLKLLQIN